jgi:anti-sigma B factor antagonist
MRRAVMEDQSLTATAATPAVVTLSVVTLPAEIDATNSSRVEADLAAACVPGVSVVVADLSETTFCDSTGMRALVHAHHLAASLGIEFRLVVTAPAVLRILELTGLMTVLRLYPSTDAAVGGG